MYRYDSTPIDIDEKDEDGICMYNPKQVSQISLNWEKDRVIEVCYETDTGKVIIGEQHNNWYYFTSPNIPKMRMIDVLYGLGFRNETILVDWNETNLPPNDILKSFVTEAPLNQITLFKPDREEMPDLTMEISLLVILATTMILCIMWC